MGLPFTATEFFAVFAAYNTAVWPLQLVLAACGLFVVVALARTRSKGPVATVLTGLWLWMGLVYHWRFFAPINPAARGFAVVFVAAAATFAWFGLSERRVHVPVVGTRRLVGWTLIAYALVGYPLIAYLAGQRYPAVPTFGLPCPTTIFTLGTLLLVSSSTPIFLFVIPLLWSAIGTLGAVQLGVVEDYGLGAAGLVTLALLVAQRRRAPSGRREQDRRESRLSRRQARIAGG